MEIMEANRTALICGVSGQDGCYLARLLLQKGYVVYGTARDPHGPAASNLRKLGIHDKIRLLSMDLLDLASVVQTLTATRPDEIYNLAGQSSVGLSFEQPVETIQSIAGGTLNILEAMRLMKRPMRLYNAGSGECFGDTGGLPANEDTPFRPRSPYAIGKASAFWQVATYREAYGVYACTGILFNHESPLRPAKFVTSKVVAAACRIASGSGERLRLGNIAIERDWGWAPEYVEAMWRMLQRPQPEDFVIATGTSSKLADFIQAAFASVGLEWRSHVDIDEGLLRPTDVAVVRADPGRAERVLGWRAATSLPEVVRLMIDVERGVIPVCDV
jgi:GDPmannose 4,6-dehydratase